MDVFFTHPCNKRTSVFISLFQAQAFHFLIFLLFCFLFMSPGYYFICGFSVFIYFSCVALAIFT